MACFSGRASCSTRWSPGESGRGARKCRNSRTPAGPARRFPGPISLGIVSHGRSAVLILRKLRLVFWTARLTDCIDNEESNRFRRARKVAFREDSSYRVDRDRPIPHVPLGYRPRRAHEPVKGIAPHAPSHVPRSRGPGRPLVLSAGEGSTFAIMPGTVTTAGQSRPSTSRSTRRCSPSPKKNGEIVARNRRRRRRLRQLDRQPRRRPSSPRSSRSQDSSGHVIRVQHTRYDPRLPRRINWAIHRPRPFW